VFARNDIPTYKFTEIIYDLGMFYNYTYLMVERNSYGIDILQRLHKEKQYANLAKTKRKDAITGRRKWEHGWYSDNVSKTILVNDLKESVETGLVLINDIDTLEQMKIYQEKNGKFGNIRGENNYDDLVDALALAVQAMKQGRYYV
ncbi:MAG: DNA packaging protein, partial [Thermoanaerobacteraceae bacterium]|nr:DNA packaging protein [Thermoanaerobacteraceae bacterium]